MRKLAVVEFVTLDGVMQSLGGPDEDREGGFDHGGWNGPYGDETGAAGRAGDRPNLGIPVWPQDLRAHGCALAPRTRRQPHGSEPQRHAEVRGDEDATPAGPGMGQLPRYLSGDIVDAVGELKAQSERLSHRTGQRRSRADAHRQRTNRHLPDHAAPARARHGQATVPGVPPPTAAAAHRVHTNHDRCTAPHLRARVGGRSPPDRQPAKCW